MNLFVTDECPVKSAIALPDILVNKMAQEAIQLMSVAHFELDGVQRGTKPSHKNHPCAIFTRNNKLNYEWVRKHARALLDEYTFRTGKVHGYEKYYAEVTNPPENIAEKGDDFFPMCMPAEHKKTLDVHKNYQYYLNCKFNDWATRTDKRQIFVTWSKRNKPEWLSI